MRSFSKNLKTFELSTLTIISTVIERFSVNESPSRHIIKIISKLIFQKKKRKIKRNIIINKIVKPLCLQTDTKYVCT